MTYNDEEEEGGMTPKVRMPTFQSIRDYQEDVIVPKADLPYSPPPEEVVSDAELRDVTRAAMRLARKLNWENKFYSDTEVNRGGRTRSEYDDIVGFIQEAETELDKREKEKEEEDRKQRERAREERWEDVSDWRQERIQERKKEKEQEKVKARVVSPPSMIIKPSPLPPPVRMGGTSPGREMLRVNLAQPKKLQGFVSPYNSPIAQLSKSAGGFFFKKPTPTRGPTRLPTPLPTRVPTRAIASTQVEEVLSPGEVLVTPYEGPVLFWIGTRQGTELGEDVWITKMRTGSYRFRGIGTKTGEPRSKTIGNNINNADKVATKMRRSR